jgi:hypothetical protein
MNHQVPTVVQTHRNREVTWQGILPRMDTPLAPCLGCRRHVRDDAPACPFCGHQRTCASPRSSSLNSPLGAASLALSAALLLAGCKTGEIAPENPAGTPGQAGAPGQTSAPGAMATPAPSPSPTPAPTPTPVTSQSVSPPTPTPTLTTSNPDHRPAPKYGMPPNRRAVPEYGAPSPLRY